MLETKDGLGIEEVMLAIPAPLVLAPLQEPARPRLSARKSAMVVMQSLGGNLR